jgi:hypothetical protein
MKVTEANLSRVAKAVEDASHDEKVTRSRVELLEKAAGAYADILGRGLWGRLKWLVVGR